jgi:prepilin-type N-terminal cleavage/methylation domain-containing protein
MRIRLTTGFTLIELLIVVTLIGVIVAIAVPGLLRARMAGNEASAIASLRAIIDGQSAYSSSCAGGGYAVTLADLARPAPNATQGFVSPDLKTDPSVKSGYTVALFKETGAATIGTAGATCNGSTTAPASAYEATADPVTAGVTGGRYFGTDTRATIFFSNLASFGTAVIPTTATPVQ